MKIAYVDSSCFLAIAFCEPGYRQLMSRLARLDLLLSSALLEAEVRSALAREGTDGSWRNLFAWVSWVHPDRRLTLEISTVLSISRPRGSDLWHLACALSLRPKISDLAFFTLDENQETAARQLGFPVL